MLAVSFDEHDPEPELVDGTRRFKVTGTVEGLDPGARVSIALNGGTAVEVGNEPFELPDSVLDGEAYAIVTSQAAHACAATPASGRVEGADVRVVVQCLSDDATLRSVDVSKGIARGALEPAFDPATLVYRVRLPLVPILEPAAEAVVVATANNPRATVNVGGVQVASGAASTVPIRPVDVTVTSVSGRKQTTYTLALDAQQAYVKASNARASTRFGASVALAGDTLAVGAYYESSNATGVNGNQADTSAPNAGAVYIFTRTAGAWAQQAYLKASNARAGSQFGQSVALSGDTLAVGAHSDSSNATGVNGNQADTSAPAAGAVYVFTRTAGVWTQQAYLKASNTRVGSYFGLSVALSGDMLAVGAPAETSSATGVNGNQADTSAPAAGAVYVFTRNAGVWAQIAYLKASNTRSGSQFGVSLALSGGTLAVGAMFESSNATGVNGNQANTSAGGAGAAYVFTLAAGVWTQQAYVKASNTRTNSRFGKALTLAGDTLVVGAPAESSSATGVNGDQADTSAAGAGAAYVFSRTAGVWTQRAYLKASNTRAGAAFGSLLALTGDTLAVTSVEETSNAVGVNGDQANASLTKAGAAYVFTRTAGVWAQRAYLKASNTRAGAQFGSSVALSADTFAVGAEFESSGAAGVNGDQSDTRALQAGAVYVF